MMRDAEMSASYKPALLKALARICRSSDSVNIPLGRIGEEFARMYWKRTVLFHLRQAAALTKEAEVIKAIRRAAATHTAREYEDLPLSAMQDLRKRMARILTLNVLTAFHKSKPHSMEPLYHWTKSANGITLSGEALMLLRNQGVALVAIANYYWATFLEVTNRLAPRIIGKVEGRATRRRPLERFLRMLSEDGQRSCFYCGTTFDSQTTPTVDHVIPWAFLFEDPDWDLVLACAPCNSPKSDWLPDESFIAKLTERNRVRTYRSLPGIASALIDEQVIRYYEAAISVEWPGFWKPT